MSDNDHKRAKLYDILATLNGAEEFEAFFDDMCTDKEIEHMAERVECARRLLHGETYQQIIAATDVSAATLSRVSRCLQYGSGGYNRLLKRFYENHEQKETDDDQ